MYGYVVDWFTRQHVKRNTHISEEIMFTPSVWLDMVKSRRQAKDRLWQQSRQSSCKQEAQSHLSGGPAKCKCKMCKM